MTEIKRLLSVKDAQAALGGISRTTVYKLIDSGKLQRVKVGTRTMIPYGSLVALMTRPPGMYDEPSCCSCPVHCPK